MTTTPPPSPPPSGPTLSTLGTGSATTPDRPDGRVRGGRGSGLVLLGGLTFGIMYGLSVLAAAIAIPVGNANEDDGRGKCTDSAGYVFIPLAGPILFAAEYPNHVKYYETNGAVSDCSSSMVAVNAVSGAVAAIQIGGAAALVTGIVLNATEEDEVARAVTVAPSPDGAGQMLMFGRAF